MRCINIKAAAEVSEIDIFGDIGESFFSQGVTIEGVRAQLMALDSPSLVVNVSSLGGDAAQGLAIHDMIKAYPGRVTTKIIGATASAGTVIAMAGDTVEMSENAVFLVHNTWTMMAGDAEDMRKTAGDLDKFDQALVNVYKKKTGRRESTIKSLMAEDKWISADEAKEFGFVDKVFTPTKAMASAMKDQIAKIKQSKDLPKIEDEMNVKEQITEAFASIKAEISEWLTGQNDQKELKELNEVKEVIEGVKAQIAEKDGEIDGFKAKIAELEASVTTLTQENEELKAKAESKPSVEAPKSDASPKGDKPKMSLSAQIASELWAEIPESEKVLYKRAN